MLASMGKVHTKIPLVTFHFKALVLNFIHFGGFWGHCCLAGCLGAKDAEKDKNAALEKEALTKHSSRKLSLGATWEKR